MKCRVADCHAEANVRGTAKGLCRSHYKRLIRYGDEEAPLRKTRSWAGAKCTEPGCRKRARVRGLCLNHYAVFRRGKKFDGNRRRSEAFKARYRAQQEIAMGRPRPNACEVCGGTGYERANKPNTGIVFDHDHVSGHPRGWLCDRCNKVLGLVKDNGNLLVTLAIYLEAHNGKIHPGRDQAPRPHEEAGEAPRNQHARRDGEGQAQQEPEPSSCS